MKFLTLFLFGFLYFTIVKTREIESKKSPFVDIEPCLCDCNGTLSITHEEIEMGRSGNPEPTKNQILKFNHAQRNLVITASENLKKVNGQLKKIGNF
jgi:hypothetical protein